MRKIIFFFSILLTINVSSCKQNEDFIDPQNLLIGTWVYKDYVQIDSTQYAIVYERKAKFDDNNSGISFKVNSQLIERKNVGWCGTPPISYGEYGGNFYLKDKVITTNSDSWNGKILQRYEVISVDDKLLKIKRL